MSGSLSIKYRESQQQKKESSTLHWHALLCLHTIIKYTSISLGRACTMFLCSIQIKCEKWLYLKDGVLHIVDLNTSTIRWGLARQQCFKPKQKRARLKYRPNYLCEKVWQSGRTASALAKTVHWNAWICHWQASRFRHIK